MSEERLTDELLALLTYLTKGAQPDVFRVVAELELSMTHFRALHILEASERDLALGELAERVGLSVAAMGRAVDALVRGDLASRREDAADRRVKRIGISEHGREIVDRLVAARRDGTRALVERLSERERDDLSRALAPVLARPEVQAVQRGRCR